MQVTHLDVVARLQRPWSVDCEPLWTIRDVGRRTVHTRPAIVQREHAPEGSDTFTLLNRVSWRRQILGRWRPTATTDQVKTSTQRGGHSGASMISGLEAARITEEIMREEDGCLRTVENCARMGARETSSGASKSMGEERRFIRCYTLVLGEVDPPEIHDVEQYRGECAAIGTGHSIVKRLGVKEEPETGRIVEEIVNPVPGK